MAYGNHALCSRCSRPLRRIQERSRSKSPGPAFTLRAAVNVLVLPSKCRSRSTDVVAVARALPPASRHQRHGTRETAPRPAPDAEGQCMDALGAAKYRGATVGAQRYVGAILRTRCGRASTTQFCISQMHAMHQRWRGPLCWQLRCRAGHGNDDTMRLVGNSHGRCDGRDHARRRRHAACRCGQMSACRAIGDERRQRRSDR